MLPSQGIRDTANFKLKHLGLPGRSGAASDPTWTNYMSTADWVDLAAADAPFPPDIYVATRDHPLAQSARLPIDKRKTAGQLVEGPELDATIVPVVTALDSPKFDGLAAAVTSPAIDLTIPAPDYTAQEAVAGTVSGAQTRRPGLRPEQTARIEAIRDARCGSAGRASLARLPLAEVARAAVK